jgi:hypothetical protein
VDEYEYDDFLSSQDEDVEEHDQPTSPVRLLISLNPTPYRGLPPFIDWLITKGIIPE